MGKRSGACKATSEHSERAEVLTRGPHVDLGAVTPDSTGVGEAANALEEQECLHRPGDCSTSVTNTSAASSPNSDLSLWAPPELTFSSVISQSPPVPRAGQKWQHPIPRAQLFPQGMMA